MKFAIIILTAIFSSTALANVEVTSYELNMDEVQVEKIEMEGHVTSNMQGLFKEFKYKGGERKPQVLIAKASK